MLRLTSSLLLVRSIFLAWYFSSFFCCFEKALLSSACWDCSLSNEVRNSWSCFPRASCSFSASAINSANQEGVDLLIAYREIWSSMTRLRS